MKKIEKNYKSACFFDEKMVELGCKFTLTIINLLIQKSTEVNIDLNAKDGFGWTALTRKCKYSRQKK